MKNIFKVKGLADYLLQVSLIILSIFIATGLNRCNENRKDDRKRINYLKAIGVDLENEISNVKSAFETGEMDELDLEAAIRLSKYPDIDSLQLSMAKGLTVVVRGYYRSFRPMTFETMSQTGDLLLIDNLEYRNSLAGTIEFRNRYLKEDMDRHDEAVLEMADALGDYIALACANATNANISCLRNTEGYRLYSSNIYVKMLRRIQLRLFHLEIAQEDLLEMLEQTRKQLQK